MLDDSLFEDSARLAEIDTDGLLRSAALAGAQVRSAAETAAEVDLSDLADARPRALVLVARAGVGPGACDMLAALLAPTCPVPVVRADSVPSWAGPLDVVFAHTGDAGDSLLAESLERAARQGANVVLSAPADGPVAASVAGRAKVLPPKVPVPGALSVAHVFTAGLCVARELGFVQADTDVLADEVDRQSALSHPSQEISTNPAKSLALRVADHQPLLWGLNAVSTAVAGHAAFALGCHAGVPCDVAGYAQAACRYALHRAGASTGTEADLFADPEDGPAAHLRVFLISTRYGDEARVQERAAVAALPGADVLAPVDTAPEDSVVRSMMLASRFDLAAVYLGLAAGTLDGPGRASPPTYSSR
ncbi:phosphoglucose isomerase-like protein [Halopolyspora algeriensis]|uniref:Phosphoglucose isomerase-like protein n=1 Tax=Halopolyspora algeriensis TaxID=1500506 RepID=A0A368VJP3_9ACTN|nr:SIS domain-containing protein [Halopolyspora algeriensis]RCW39211.1 phosphoglucose isomerase-like protein [Halopolyspora algeriensis]TQM47422.1 phosphoglucose isomerase-like protein [Halopolyspora algeriensis]